MFILFVSPFISSIFFFFYRGFFCSTCLHYFFFIFSLNLLSYFSCILTFLNFSLSPTLPFPLSFLRPDLLLFTFVFQSYFSTPSFGPSYFFLFFLLCPSSNHAPVSYFTPFSYIPLSLSFISPHSSIPSFSVSHSHSSLHSSSSR